MKISVLFNFWYFINCEEAIYKLNNAIVTQYELPNLPFGYDELEPFIDIETVTVHHKGHHAAYTTKLNAALESWRKENPSVNFQSYNLCLKKPGI